MTGRNFNEVSEDPAAAVRAFRLRSQFRKNAGQMEMNEETMSRVAAPPPQGSACSGGAPAVLPAG